MEEQNNLNSEWNYGGSYLFTIRQLENDIIGANRSGDLDLWLLCVEDLYNELNRRMKPEEQRKAEELLNKARNTINRKQQNARNKYFNLEQKNSKRELNNITIYLKDIIKKRKMDLPTKEDPTSAMLDD